jgi:hypothetical protein
MQRLILCRMPCLCRGSLVSRQGWKAERPGDELIMISVWLGDAAGKSRVACWYAMVQVHNLLVSPDDFPLPH